MVGDRMAARVGWDKVQMRAVAVQKIMYGNTEIYLTTLKK
jgi:hypothetical protein